MKELKEDILKFALTEYYRKRNITEQDALHEKSEHGSKGESWSALLLSLMIPNDNRDDPFNLNKTLTADPVHNNTLFNEQLKELQHKTIHAAFAGGALCQKWICEDIIPYTANKQLEEAEQFIENT